MRTVNINFNHTSCANFFDYPQIFDQLYRRSRGLRSNQRNVKKKNLEEVECLSWTGLVGVGTATNPCSHLNRYSHNSGENLQHLEWMLVLLRSFYIVCIIRCSFIFSLKLLSPVFNFLSLTSSGGSLRTSGCFLCFH